jgi:cytochrome c peroxidase
MKNTNDARRGGLSGALAISVALAALLSTQASSHDHRDDSPGRQPDFIPEIFQPIRNLQPFPNSSGAVATFNQAGHIDTRNAFFKSLGTNGRSCATCHVASQAFSISPPQIRERFAQSHGRDPLFAAVDGANCTTAKRSDPAAHSLLLKHGLIRVANTLPATAEFTISVVRDPYGCALATDAKTGLVTASVYRRPLPTTNINFLSTVMWDGRETLVPLNSGATFLANLGSDLSHQVTSAVTIHAEATVPPTQKQIAEIVAFERGLYTAQTWDWRAGSLELHGAQGGPVNLGNEDYYPGINDSLGAEPTGEPFSPNAMSAFAAWAKAKGNEARRHIAAGEALFNTAPLSITTVRGLNDNATLGKPATIPGTCTTCHDTPNAGNHSLPLPLDIGVGHPALANFEKDPNVAAGLAELDEPDLPVFVINGCHDPFDATRSIPLYTTDPGKGLITGLCSDVNRVKGPVLRSLAARAPYFHNGAAATLLEAVNFYNERFQMKLTDEQKRDLVAFLNSL